MLAMLEAKLPDTPFWLMLLVAATAGLGGGNFASSMANISFFYPDRIKGWALGLNAAGGNIGVSGVQLLTPLLLGFGFISLYQATPTAEGLYLQNAGLMWLLPLTIAVIGAFFFMNNLTSARSTFKDQLAIVKRKHTWIMSYIYIGTFGSFIGYSAAFPLLIKTQFPAVTVAIAFLGPLVGSLSRPLGGLLADKIGGAKVTFWNFIAMGAATIGVMYFVEIKDFAGFLTMFLILFVATGIGNGSTYRMIPSIFREEKLREAKGSGETGRALALKAAGIEAAAALGFIGAVGACGGYLIPRGFGASIAATGGSASGAANLPCLLRDLHSAHVVVLSAQEPPRTACAEPRRSARVRQARSSEPSGRGHRMWRENRANNRGSVRTDRSGNRRDIPPPCRGGIAECMAAAARRRPENGTCSPPRSADLRRVAGRACRVVLMSAAWSHSRSSSERVHRLERRPPLL